MSKRKRLERYLKDHFRYSTMNSWNLSTSYAKNVKIRNLNMDRETRERAYDLLDVHEAFFEINMLIADFDRDHDYVWQAGFNGRSGGYIVLYQGGKKDSGYKTRCNECNKLTWYETEQPCHMDGCEGTLKVLTEKAWRTFAYSGKGTDQDADFSEWEMYELEDRVRLVREFDELCDKCVASFINFAKTHKVEDREILVPKTVQVAISLD